ncbi:MAG: GTP cyclohydrolase, FolE2/MptA family [Candidatus Hodarchaeales archaeon]|jgi:GTP cyclohydrolase-4
MENVQTQDQEPVFQISLNEVGISRLKTLVNIHRNGDYYRFIVSTDIRVNLPSHLKGVHMSRLVESATEIFADETRKHPVSIERLAENVLETLHERFPFNRGIMIMRFDFAHAVVTPVSKRRSIEVYPIKIKSIRDENGRILHHVSISSLGNTACPHALAIAEGKRTHVQRAIARLTVVGELSAGELGNENLPMFEDMIEVLEMSFSSPTFSVLKTVDESWVVENMFNNPLFCEDACRTLLGKANKRFRKNKVNFYAKVRAEESIHKHDVIASGEIIKFKDLKQ